VLAAARAATRQSLGAGAPEDASEEEWAPHLTLCYSTTEQDAAPVIAELGKAVPACEVTISEMSLVVQNGPEHLWDWHVAGSVRLLGEPGSAQRQEALQRRCLRRTATARANRVRASARRQDVPRMVGQPMSAPLS
jgi:hypothetical protein